MAEGVDYAYPPIPTAQQLRNAGKEFVVRYGGVGSEDKWLSLGEAQALDAAGIKMVANAEYQQRGLLGGYNVGALWAEKGMEYFTGLGMPSGRPIYLSVDFQPESSAEWSAITEAFRGASNAIGADRVGVYGSFQVMQRMAATRYVQWFWQTYAWSTGQWFSGNHLEQYRNHVSGIGSGTVDLCRSKKTDYGQWGLAMTDSWSIPDAHAARDRIDSTVHMKEDISFDVNGVAGKNELVLFLKDLGKKIDTLLGRPSTVIMSDAQMEALGALVAEHLGLNEDQVKDAVKAALREGTN